MGDRHHELTYTKSWYVMVIHEDWMIWGVPRFRKPPFVTKQWRYDSEVTWMYNQLLSHGVSYL